MWFLNNVKAFLISIIICTRGWRFPISSSVQMQNPLILPSPQKNFNRQHSAACVNSYVKEPLVMSISCGQNFAHETAGTQKFLWEGRDYGGQNIKAVHDRKIRNAELTGDWKHTIISVHLMCQDKRAIQATALCTLPAKILSVIY